MLDSIYRYTQTKRWAWFVPVWLLAAYGFVEILQFKIGEEASGLLMPFTMTNFGVHELAHVFASGFPAVITASAGSFSEVLLAGLVLFAAFRTGQYFAAVFGSLWLMLALSSAGQYMADARLQKLPLVSIDGDVTLHDWHFVFKELDLLDQASAIGGAVRGLGVLAGMSGLAFALWLIYLMYTAPQRKAAAKDRPVLRTTTPPFHTSLYPEATRAVAAPKALPQSDGEKPAAAHSPTLYPDASRGPLGSSKKS